MAQSIPPGPTSTPQGSGSTRRQSASDSENPSPQTPEEVVAALRAAITAGEWDLGSALEKLTVAAHRLTHADGAAIAMLQGGLVICRARSGTLAPELGTPLSVDSGISGECLRTGQSMRCDDTAKDLRVDAEVCARLGLRSIAVVPLRGTHRVVGILEAFSSRAYSFPDRHLQLMAELSDLAVAARSAQRQNPRTSAAPTRPTTATERQQEAALSRLRQATVSASRTLRHSMPVLGVLFTSVAVIALALGIGWMLFRGRSAQATPPPTTAHAAAKPSSEFSPASSAALVFNGAAGGDLPSSKPSPLVLSRTSQKTDIAPGSVVQKASQTEALPVGARSDSSQTGASTPAAANFPAGEPQPPTQAKMDSTMAALADAGRADPSIVTVLSVTPDLPALSLPVSQGVTDGVVIKKIQPIYPEMARHSRIEGRVVLQATITEEGMVRDLKIVSGHPVLAHAAEEAVAQWRYKPYRLDGKPVSMPTEIKLDFKLP